MVLTTQMLLEKLSEYADPYGRIRRLCNEGKLHQVTRGVYETDGSLDSKLLSSVIYGPSYVSFSYALSQYGLIPERVVECTCATCGKGKRKSYRNEYGSFSYRDVPAEAFPFDTMYVEENGHAYSIATPEKALCDRLYELPPVRNRKELESLLFDDLRIDRNIFERLDASRIRELSALYRSNNVRLLAEYMEEKHDIVD